MCQGAQMKQGEQIRTAILAAIRRQPGSNPSQGIQKQFGVSREAVRLHFKKLVNDGLIVGKGYGKGTVYSPGNLNQGECIDDQTELSFDQLRQLGEDQAYAQYIAPLLKEKLNSGLAARVHHVSTEILNNVIDHSKARGVRIHIQYDKRTLWLEIADDGLGVYHTIKEAFQLSNYIEAVGELAKGKRSRDPSRHAGEGIFFSCRMANRFSLEANGISYAYDSTTDDWGMQPIQKQVGSKLLFEFNGADRRMPKDVFDRYTQDYQFQINSPRLVSPYTIVVPKGEFPSRAEAKKILAGAEGFKSIVIDFRNVQGIGQGFADEMFRVFPAQHPSTELEVVGANELVLAMIAHVGGKPRITRP